MDTWRLPKQTLKYKAELDKTYGEWKKPTTGTSTTI